MKQRGDDFGSFGVGVPYFRACYGFFRWWSSLLAGGFRAGDRLLNNNRVPGEMPIPLAHNAIVREFLRPDNDDLDTLCIIEDDHVADQMVIERMRDKEENRDFDIVCASYPNRRNQPVAIGCNFADSPVSEYGEYMCSIEPLKVARRGTQQYDVAALGLVLIRRWVLEALRGDQEDLEEFLCFDWRGRNSQDIRFYWETRKLGARVGVDRDNPIGHIGMKTYTMDWFYQERDRILAEHMKQLEEANDNGGTV